MFRDQRMFDKKSKDVRQEIDAKTGFCLISASAVVQGRSFQAQLSYSEAPITVTQTDGRRRVHVCCPPTTCIYCGE